MIKPYYSKCNLAGNVCTLRPILQESKQHIRIKHTCEICGEVWMVDLFRWEQRNTAYEMVKKNCVSHAFGKVI